jgi:hypothetical protein
MLSISKDKLRELLLLSYESGWTGCPELKHEFVDQLMQQFDRTDVSSDLTVSCPTYSVSVNGGLGLTEIIPGYYSTFGQTSPIETTWVDNSGQDTF